MALLNGQLAWNDDSIALLSSEPELPGKWERGKVGNTLENDRYRLC